MTFLIVKGFSDYLLLTFTNPLSHFTKYLKGDLISWLSRIENMVLV